MRLFKNRISQASPKWSFLSWYDIILDNQLYLSRFNIIQTPWFGIKIHWILRPDPDRSIHTHPWRFISFVLKGGYSEYYSKRPDKSNIILSKRINWFNYHNIKSAHQIYSVSPKTLTLVFTGKRVESWGFYKDGKFIDWKYYHDK